MKMAASYYGTCIVVLLALCCTLVLSDPNLTVTSKGCSDETYDTSKDPYQQSVDYVLNDLLTVTPNSPGFNRNTQSPFVGIPTAYGRGTCTATLTAADCVSCIISAYGINRGNCNGRVTGFAYLGDCTMEYKNAPF